MKYSADDLYDKLSYIYDEFGIEVFSSKKLISLLRDLAPELNKDTKMIQKMVDLKIMPDLVAVSKKSLNDRKTTLEKSALILSDSEFIQNKIGKFYAQMIIDVLRKERSAITRTRPELEETKTRKQISSKKQNAGISEKNSKEENKLKLPESQGSNKSSTNTSTIRGASQNTVNPTTLVAQPKSSQSASTITIIAISIVIIALLVALIFVFGNNSNNTGTNEINQQIQETPPQSNIDQTQSNTDQNVDQTNEDNNVASTPPTTTSNEYILPDSNVRYLSESDLEGLSKQEVQIARNEISARHGRKYNTEWLQNYFNQQSWYTPIYEPDEFDAMANDIMSDVEVSNMYMIKDYEDARGW